MADAGAWKMKIVCSFAAVVAAIAVAALCPENIVSRAQVCTAIVRQFYCCTQFCCTLTGIREKLLLCSEHSE